MTKGKIAVTSRPGLQVVASNEAATTKQTATHSEASQESVATASWLKEPSDTQITESRSEPQPYTDPQIATGPSMKLIKLMAAAGGLAVAAIILAFLQFSGPSEDAAGAETAAAQTSAVLNAASASTLTSTTAATATTEPVSSDLVAQITAGTLAALRTGASNRADVGAGSATSQAGAVTSEQPTALYAMVMQAVQQGQSVQYIDRLVNEAYQADKIAVPAVLLTSAGTVDTKTLLTLFVGAAN